MKFLTCLAVCLLSAASYAQYSIQIFNVHSDPVSGSKPFGYAPYMGKTYFYTSLTPEHLYSSDGVSFTPMPNPDALTNGMIPDLNFCEVKGLLYFSAKKPGDDHRVYQYDGINAPTVATGVPNTTPANFIELNGKLYFISFGGPQSQIQRYDPDTKTVLQMSNYTAGSDLQKMFRFGDKLVVTVDDRSGAGVEPHIYDPQAGTFALMADINPGADSSHPESYEVLNGKLYFVARTAANGNEMYEYDGVNAPVRITDVNPGPGNSFGYGGPKALCAYKGAIYFTAAASTTGTTYALYKYEPGGVVSQVHNMKAGSDARWLEVYGRNLYFVSDSNNNAVKINVFKYDGTNAPVSLTALTGQQIYNPWELKAVNGRLFFTANELLTSGNFEPFVFTDSMALDVPGVAGRNNTAIYPNPATSEARISFTLQQTTTLNVQLTNIQGRTVYAATMRRSAGAQEIVVPVRELAAGNYMFMVVNSEGQVLGKGRLVKE